VVHFFCEAVIRLKIEVLTELNAVLETVSLLIGYYNQAELTEEKYWENLAENGITKDKRLDDVYRLIERVYGLFIEKAVVEEGDEFFFKGKEESLAFALMTLLLDNKERELVSIDEVPESEVRQLLIDSFFESDRKPQTTADVFEIFKEAEEEAGASNPEFNWKFLLIFEEPKKYLSRFIDILNRNILVFYEIFDAMKGTLDPLLASFEANCETFIHYELENLSSFVSKDGVRVVPMLVGALGFMVVEEDLIFAGLCYHEIYGYLDRREQPVEKVVPALKVLGDNSKFEILRFLKEAPNYNVEIAKHMGLTPATVSHHMTALFSLSLVTMEQVNKKVYYSVNEEQIKKIIANLEIAFL